MTVIPEGWGEREPKPRSARWPAEMMRRVERVADLTGHDDVHALFYLVRWALDEFDAQRTRDGLPDSKSEGTRAKKKRGGDNT
jgi:hypothetical protein